MIKIDENDPIGEVDPSFPYRDVVIRKNTDMKEFYDLQKEIGRGKFGTVYRCTEKATGLKLAAKFIGISKRQDRRNAEREVEIMRELQHPRLIQMYDAFEINNIMCVVLELIEGGELFERVIDDDFILTEKSVSVFMRQICEGIAFIHSKNILHLDMKPENILCLTKTGNRIKIIDFGLARKYDPEKKLQVLFGTPEFVAPEVVNFDSIGFGTDMWSVGVICYVLLSGLSPFMGETDVQTMANVTIAQYDFDDEAFNDISTDAKDFIGKLLLKDREQRMSATECLSHRWLQRRKPPVVSSTTSPTPTISQSELDLQKDTLRYLVDRWNNDTNITLVLNKDDDKYDKVVDICKTNGTIDQQSKSMVCESSHLPANDTTIQESAIQHPPHETDITNKSTNLETTLVPIQSIEAPSVSNQVLKSLTDVVSTDRPAQNLKRSLSPDTIKTETSKKEQSAKIPKSLTPSRSGSISPGIRKNPIFDGAESIKDEPSPKLPKPSKLETSTESSKKELSEVKKLKLKIPAELSQNEFSEVDKSPSVSPKPIKKKTLAKTSSPSIKDHPIDHKNELKTSQEEIRTNELNQKLPKSPSSLEIPKTLPQQKEFREIQKSPSTSPKPLKRSPSKTPSPLIMDQPDKFIPIKEEMILSQEIPQPSILNLPENSTHIESSIKKSPSTSPKPLQKKPTKSPSPSIKDQPNECIPITVEIKSSQEIPNPSILSLPENSTHIESSIKKSPSTSPKPLQKKPTKSPSPSIKDQPNEFIPITVEIKSSQEIPNPSILNLPENSTHIESSIKKSPSTSPKPLKKNPIKSPSPSIKDQPNEFIVPIKVEIESRQEIPNPSILNLPENSTHTESSIKKSPSTSPKPLKKKPIKSASSPIKDQPNEFIVPIKVEVESRQEIPKSSILNLPENSTHTESSTVKKSPSASPKLSKKVPIKPPSPSIQDQLFDKKNIATKISPPVTPEKFPQRDISDGKKLLKTVPQSVASSDTIPNKYQSKIFEKLSAPTSDAKICDIVKQNTIVDKTSQLVNSKDNVHSTVSSFNLAQHDDKLENEFNTLPTTDSHSTQTPDVELAQAISKEITKRSNDKLQDIPTTHSINQSQSIRTPTVEISDETYEYVKKRRFTIKSVESTKTADNENSTIHTKSTEKNTMETSPQFPHRRSIFSPDVSPKVLRKLNDFVSSSELMKRRISDISNLLTRTGQDMEQSLPDDMSSFCSKLNRIVRLRHDSYSIDGSSNPNYKRPKFRMSFLSRDVPFSSTSPVNADLLNYLPHGEETLTTSLWSFQKTNPFHSDPSSLRNSPERFSSPSFTKKLLSKFFNDSLEYDISSTPSTSTNGLPKDKITEIIS